MLSVQALIELVAALGSLYSIGCQNVVFGYKPNYAFSATIKPGYYSEPVLFESTKKKSSLATEPIRWQAMSILHYI